MYRLSISEAMDAYWGVDDDLDDVDGYLYTALERDDLGGISMAIANGANVNALADGVPFIDFAMSLPALRILLMAGANPNQLSFRGHNPLATRLDWLADPVGDVRDTMQQIALLLPLSSVNGTNMSGEGTLLHDAAIAAEQPELTPFLYRLMDIIVDIITKGILNHGVDLRGVTNAAGLIPQQLTTHPTLRGLLEPGT